jgi:hypothetical protein
MGGSVSVRSFNKAGRMPLRHAVIVLAALLLSGCYYSKNPVLDAAEGDPLPGGPGLFEREVTHENLKAIERIEVSEAKIGAGHGYAAIHTRITNGATTVERYDALLKQQANNRYVVQLNMGPEGGYKILVAEIDAKEIRFATVTEPEVVNVAANLGIEIMATPRFPFDSGLEQAVRSGKTILARNPPGSNDGPALYAPKEKALAVAAALAGNENFAFIHKYSRSPSPR